MNLYQHKEIKNRLDRRLLDLFIQQNQQNDWLTLTECACWVFETNAPSEYHKTYTRNKLTALVGAMGTRAQDNSCFEREYKPEVVGRFIYRLKDAGVIKCSKAESLYTQINNVFSSGAAPLRRPEAREFCLDDLDF